MKKFMALLMSMVFISGQCVFAADDITDPVQPLEIADEAVSDAAVEDIPLDAYADGIWLDKLSPYMSQNYEEYRRTDNKSLTIGGVEYKDCFALAKADYSDTYTSYAYYNVDNQYTKFDFKVGHIDGTSDADAILKIYLDGICNNTYNLKASDTYISVSVPLTSVKQMYIELTCDGWRNTQAYGFADGKLTASGANETAIKTTDFLDVLPPYVAEMYDEYRREDNAYITMDGKKYTNGFTFAKPDYTDNYSSYAYYNIDKQYSQLSFRVGHVDNSSREDAVLNAYVDGIKIYTKELKWNELSSNVSIPLKDDKGNIGSLLKLEMTASGWRNTQAYAFVEGQFTKNTSAPKETEVTLTDFLDQLPPYLTDAYNEHRREDNDIVVMDGKKYTNGFTFEKPDYNDNYNCYAYYNIDKQYSKMLFRIGHVDNSTRENAILNAYVDGIKIFTEEIAWDELSKRCSIPLYDDLGNIGSQLKLELVTSGWRNTQKYLISEVELVKTGNTPTSIKRTNWLNDCAIHDTTEDHYKQYTSAEGKSFKMGGWDYTNGFIFEKPDYNDDYTVTAYFTLGKKYKNLSFTVGHIDDSTREDAVLKAYIDGILIRTETLKWNELPKKLSIDLKDDFGVIGSELKLELKAEGWRNTQKYGFAEGIFTSTSGTATSVAKTEQMTAGRDTVIISGHSYLNGGDTPTPSKVLYGDVTGDGKLDRADLTRLSKYFAGWDVEINADAADVTGNGKLDRADLTRLSKYFAGWDVELGK